MNATNFAGDRWTGERDGKQWVYQGKTGRYSSPEMPAYRLHAESIGAVPAPEPLKITRDNADQFTLAI